MCKFFTPNCAAVGECGKSSLYTRQLIRLINSWLTVVHLPDCRHPKIAYKLLRSLDEDGTQFAALR